MDQTVLPPLRRKVMAARAAGPEAARAALRLAIGRAGRAFPGGEVEAEEIALSAAGLDRMLADLPGDGLALSLSLAGPDGGVAAGLVHFAPSLLDGLVEQAVTGRVRARPAPAPAVPRAPTALDAALGAEFLQALLAEMGRAPGLAGLVQDLVAGAPAPGAQTLRYRMPPGPYRALICDIRLAPGLGGALRLWLRDTGAGPGSGADTAADAAADDQRDAEAGTWSARLADALEAISLPLVAVLHRQTMGLRALQALAPGMRIDLPPDATANIRLSVAGRVDLGLGGRLGRARGRRAVQIVQGGAQQAAPLAEAMPRGGSDA